MSEEAPETLDDALAGWDGKSREDILDIEATWGEDEAYLEDLICWVGDPDTSDAASWLLKHAQDQRRPLPDLRTALQAGAESPHWPTRLHLLQMLPDLTLDNRMRPAAEVLVFSSLSHERAMVRAWAYAGADQLAVTHADLRLRVMAVLKRARAEETAASVHARLRKCHF